MQTSYKLSDILSNLSVLINVDELNKQTKLMNLKYLKCKNITAVNGHVADTE